MCESRSVHTRACGCHDVLALGYANVRRCSRMNAHFLPIAPIALVCGLIVSSAISLMDECAPRAEREHIRFNRSLLFVSIILHLDSVFAKCTLFRRIPEI